MRRQATKWDSYVITGALVFLSALAWWYLGYTGDDSMALGVLTGRDSGDPMLMTGAGSGMALGLFLSTWTVMMVAMMFPATAPVVLLFDRWRRRRRRSPAFTVSFVGGYLAVWVAAGLLAYAAVLAVQARVESQEAAAGLGGASLLAAGAYQLSPLKHLCLTKCRSPLSLVMTHAGSLSGGAAGPARVGVIHGAYCLSCCWALVLVLLVLGLMNVAWMAAVSAVVLMEKLLPAGPQIGRVVGVALALIGAAMVVSALGA